MEPIQPFGSGVSSDVPVQKFMGCTVAKFDCSMDFASQPGSCTITIVQEDGVDLFTPKTIGSPQFFKIVDINGATIFKYNGILDSISRDTTVGDKTYKIVLVSPLKILEAVNIIITGYIGYGQTVEGLPRFFSEDGYYDIGERSKSEGYLPDGVTMTPPGEYFVSSPYSYGSNNKTVRWDKVFNLINAFGFWENESLAVTEKSGYTRSGAIAGSMRLDMLVFAIDSLINYTSSSSNKRYLGGNILYGTNTYNICGTANGYVDPIPYYYGLDIKPFIEQLLSYLPGSFVINGPTITLAELIATAADAANFDFFVELNDKQYKGGIFAANLNQTYPLSQFGGIISINLRNKNKYTDCNKPFSEFSHDLINLERPDMGDYQYAGNINPGTLLSSVGYAANNPIDFDFAFRGTEGSYPYGGKFPTGTRSDSRGTTYDGVKFLGADSLQVAVKSSYGTVGKFVVGGFQSRMNVVPRDFIYQYWGFARGQYVVTQILPPNDSWDWVAIDCSDMFGVITLDGLIYEGVYYASMLEIRAAMASEKVWNTFMYIFKSIKYKLITEYLVKVFQKSDVEIGEMFPILNKKLSSKVSHLAGRISILQNKASSFSREKDGQPVNPANLLHERIKEIGDTHYGKSWVVPIPQCQTGPVLIEDSNIVVEQPSWVVDKSAYVDPLIMDAMEAPKHPIFMSNGRMIAFANFESIVTSQGGTNDNFGYDIITKKLTPANGTGDMHYKAEDGGGITTTLTPSINNGFTKEIMHLEATIQPDDSKIIYLSTDYFEYYNRGWCPFIDFIDETGNHKFGDLYCYSYSYPSRGKFKESDKSFVKYFNSILNDPNRKTFFNSSVVADIVKPNTPLKNRVDGVEYTLHYEPVYVKTATSTLKNPAYEWNLTQKFVEIDETRTFAESGAKYVGWYGPKLSDYDDPENPDENNKGPVFAWRYTGTALHAHFNYEESTNSMLMPFVRVETPRVFYPDLVTESGVNPLGEDFLQALKKILESKVNKNKPQKRPNQPQQKSNNLYTIDTTGFSDPKLSLFPACTCPRAIGVPQQSTRYVYGPWVTNFPGIIYAGKFEYEEHKDLVPENYFISFDSDTNFNWYIQNDDDTVKSKYTDLKIGTISGIAGMNLAGQAIANSIDNFSLFAEEEGTVTLPGLPIVPSIGYELFGGPLITDISISFTNNEIKTTYNFRSLTPRYNKTDRELLKRIRKISNTLKAKISK